MIMATKMAMLTNSRTVKSLRGSLALKYDKASIMVQIAKKIQLKRESE
jgi:hypothetical protein